MYFWYFYAAVGVIVYLYIMYEDIRLNERRHEQKNALAITLTAIGFGVLWGLIILTYAYALLIVLLESLADNR